ncbi:hypothetical protein CK203_037376 [Vitis vinifera]|uniref:Uncharacterized protein n=1 Tax=Vitis vinifera TaxID=29760 RepID=A0A438HDW6_VITVI|nr:hypothetical protein CK203_037376 [Vitis vinifera]
MEPHQCNPFALFLCMFWLLIITSKADSGWDSMNQKDSHKDPADWLNHGGDLYNRRYASTETEIGPETTSKLRLKWEFYAGNDITVESYALVAAEGKAEIVNHMQLKSTRLLEC